MRLGLSSYAYAWAIGVQGHEPANPMNSFGLLQKAIDYQLSCLQIADNLPLHLLGEKERQLLADKARQHNIRIEVGMRGLIPENIEQYLDLAEFFESLVLRAVIDSDNFKPDIHSVIGIIKDYLPEFTMRNIRLAIENHDRMKAREFARIIESIGDNHVGICLDSVNSLGAGEGLDEVIRILGPYTINFHIKDFTIKRVNHMMGFIVEGTPAGKGMLPVKKILNQLTRWSRCESGILELWTPPLKDLEQTIELENKWVIESLAFLNDFFIDV